MFLLEQPEAHTQGCHDALETATLFLTSALQKVNTKREAPQVKPQVSVQRRSCCWFSRHPSSCGISTEPASQNVKRHFLRYAIFNLLLLNVSWCHSHLQNSFKHWVCICVYYWYPFNMHAQIIKNFRVPFYKLFFKAKIHLWEHYYLTIVIKNPLVLHLTGFGHG